MSNDNPDEKRIERNIKRLALALLILVALAGTGLSIYLFADARKTKRADELEQAQAEAQASGYAAALEQLVQASANNREVTVTLGEKTVKFIVVTPVEQPAATPPVTP